MSAAVLREAANAMRVEESPTLLAVADLLDRAAEWCETNPKHKHGYVDGELLVARAYLGTGDP